ncbi:hypothetical protein GCM10028808_49840 [Spirosoma migulaei]
MQATLSLGNDRINFCLSVDFRLKRESEYCWKRPEKKPFNLRIIGDGPLTDEVKEAVASLPHVEFTGWQNRSTVLAALKTCRAVLVPSVWYEGLPTVILEAFSTGTPIICSDQENLNQIVKDEQTGLLFKTGNSDDLNRVIERMNQQPELVSRLAQASRGEFPHYSKETAYKATMKLYDELVKQNLLSTEAQRTLR